MAKSKGKTISGAMDSFPNLEHNTREHIPPNSEESRRNRNIIYNQDSKQFTIGGINMLEKFFHSIGGWV